MLKYNKHVLKHILHRTVLFVRVFPYSSSHSIIFVMFRLYEIR